MKADDVVEEEIDVSGYSELPCRERSKTAPSTYLRGIIAKKTLIKKSKSFYCDFSPLCSTLGPSVFLLGPVSTVGGKLLFVSVGM